MKIDEKHRAYIRQLPCCVCLDNISTECAHVRFADPRIGKPETGIGTKPSDRFTLPLCGRCHRSQHRVRERGFWEVHGIDAILLALMLYSISGDVEEGERIIRLQPPHVTRIQSIWAAG